METSKQFVLTINSEPVLKQGSFGNPNWQLNCSIKGWDSHTSQTNQDGSFQRDANGNPIQTLRKAFVTAFLPCGSEVDYYLHHVLQKGAEIIVEGVPYPKAFQNRNNGWSASLTIQVQQWWPHSVKAKAAWESLSARMLSQMPFERAQAQQANTPPPPPPQGAPAPPTTPQTQQPAAPQEQTPAQQAPTNNFF